MFHSKKILTPFLFAFVSLSSSCSILAGGNEGNSKGGSSMQCTGCFAQDIGCIPLEVSSVDEALCGANGETCVSCPGKQQCQAGRCIAAGSGGMSASGGTAGGTPSSGGMVAKGGTPSAGGTPAAGGVVAKGGATAKGGSPGAGGVTANGGSTPAQGGSTPQIKPSATTYAAISDLTAQQSSCTAATAFSLDCQAAATRQCKDLGFVGGFGPVEFSGSTAIIVCLGGGVEYGPTIAELSAQVAPCNINNLFSVECNAAMSRYCAANGFVSGVGILETDGVGAAGICVESNRAQSIGGTFTDLATFVSGCTSVDRNSLACRSAVSRKCASMGFVSGFGPIEAINNNVSYTCVK